MLNWRTVTPSTDRRFMVKGTELSYALFARSRYRIAEVRAYDADGLADRRYVVYDAATVSDADVRAGKAPVRVASFADYDEMCVALAVAFWH